MDLEKLEEFDQHRLVIFLNDPLGNLKGFLAIHRISPEVPAFGATRLSVYASKDDALKDALKLSKLMSYKAAVAGLKYGGAKAVIIAKPSSSKQREILLKLYAEKINYLNGNFITGTDVGLDDSDLKIMRSVSPFFVGIQSKPQYFTALGLIYSIEACLPEIFDSQDLAGRSFAIQGLGKVGGELLKLLYDKAGQIFVADTDKAKLDWAKTNFPKVEIVAPGEIHKQEVDVFCPCALGGVLNIESINQLQCKMIVGGANNQLADRHIGESLYKYGILYAPDYVANSGGLISVVAEYENHGFDEPVITERVSQIKERLQKIISRSKRFKKAINLVADEMAEQIFNNH